jgi:hypothetical protein
MAPDDLLSTLKRTAERLSQYNGGPALTDFTFQIFD